MWRSPWRNHLIRGIEGLECRLCFSITPLGPETLVNTFTAGNQTVPAAAMDAQGNFVLAWQSFDQDGSDAGIFAQRFDAGGVPQGSEFRVNTFTTGAQTSPAIAMAAEGDFVVAWTSAGQDGSDTGVFAQRFSAAGVPQEAEFRVNTFTTSRQSRAAVAMDDAGNFVIGWQGSGQDGSGEGIYAQRYAASGLPLGGEFRVNTFTFGNQALASLGMAAAGDFIIAWESVGQDGSSTSVHAQRYDAAGVAQGGEFRVNAHTTDGQGAPSVAMDADGDFIVVWESYRQDGSHLGIYAQRYDAAGVAEGDEFRVNSVTTGNQSAAAVAMGAAGEFLIAWRGPDDNGFGIFAQGYFASGALNDVEQPVNTVTSSVQTAAAVAMSDDGDIVAAWQSFGQDGGGYGIYARRYEVLGGVLSSAFRYETAPHRLLFTFDQDYSASLGTEDIVVENLTTSQTIPSTDFTITYDVPTNTATFTYSGSAGGIIGVLPDGEYQATLIAAGIITPGGQPLPANYTLQFFFLRGDANHDAFVNLSDFNILAQNFGQSNRDFTQGDFNYDGQVNLADFNILAGRFGTLLGPQIEEELIVSGVAGWEVGR